MFCFSGLFLRFAFVFVFVFCFLYLFCSMSLVNLLITRSVLRSQGGARYAQMIELKELTIEFFL